MHQAWFGSNYHVSTQHISQRLIFASIHPLQQGQPKAVALHWGSFGHGLIPHARWMSSYEWMNEVNERVRVNELIRLLLIRLLRRLIRRRLIRSYTRKGVNDHELNPKYQLSMAKGHAERLICRVRWVNTHQSGPKTWPLAMWRCVKGQISAKGWYGVYFG